MNQINGQDAREILSAAPQGPVLLLGYGIVGRALRSLLTSAGYSIMVLDEAVWETEKKEDGLLVIDRWCGSPEQREILASFRPILGVFSPSILTSSKFITSLDDSKVPLVSEMDFSLGCLGMPEVAVTGTNGKTTTVSLISHILSASGIENSLLGNVGRAFSQEVPPNTLQNSSSRATHSQIIVAEVSSYQLESTLGFHPQIAVCLNICADHLDKHQTMENYIRAKAKIFARQDKDDWAIINGDDDYCWQTIANTSARLVSLEFSESTKSKERLSGALGHREADVIVHLKQREINFTLNGSDETYALDGCRLYGRHNLVNVGASIISARLLGVSQRHIAEALLSFEPLPHRLEIVSRQGGALWINDSKSTNAASLTAALVAVSERFQGHRLILLAGGRIKGDGWEEIRRQVHSNIEQVFFFGQDRWALAEAIAYDNLSGENLSSIPERGFAWACFATLAEAVSEAARVIQPGDVVIFSPGGASFDEFRNFEHRGESFLLYVEGSFPK